MRTVALILQKIESNAFLARKRNIIVAVGAATFFFGFGAGALLNVYLLSIHSPLVENFRASLTYQSAIFGDGILLPIVNMTIASFLIKYKKSVTKKQITSALCIGLLITIYFHVSQAVNHLVNWTMPTPWHWNILGLWHAIYMFSVCSFLSLFYLVTVKLSHRNRRLPEEVFVVTAGIIIFLILLHLDYVTVRFHDLVPRL